MARTGPGQARGSRPFSEAQGLTIPQPAVEARAGTGGERHGGDVRTRFLRRFSVMSAGLWVAAALLLGVGVTYVIEQRMLERTSIATLDYYQSLTRYLV